MSPEGNVRPEEGVSRAPRDSIALLTPSTLLPLAVTLASLLYFTWIGFRGLSFYADEGMFVALAGQIASGKVLFRDIVHADQVGVYLLSWIFSLFGPSLCIARGLTVAAATLCALLVFHHASRISSPLPALLAWLGFLAWSLAYWNMCAGDWMSLALVLLATECLARMSEGKSENPYLAAGGLLSAGAMAFSLPLGLLTLLGLLLYLVTGVAARGGGGRLSCLIRRTAWLMGGAILLWLPQVVYFAACGALGEMVRQTFIDPLLSNRFIQEFYVPHPLLFPPWLREGYACRYGPLELLYLIPPVIYLFSLVRLLRSPGGSSRARKTLFLCLGVCLYARLFPKAGFGHLIFTLPPAFILASSLAREIRWPPGRYSASLLLVWLAALGLWRTALDYAGDFRRTDLARLGSLRVRPEVRVELSELDVFFQRHTASGEPVFVFANGALYYHLYEITNPTRFNTMVCGIISPRDEEEIVSALERVKPRLALKTGRAEVVTFRGKTYRDCAPAVSEYLEMNYLPIRRIGQILVMRRR